MQSVVSGKMQYSKPSSGLGNVEPLNGVAHLLRDTMAWQNKATADPRESRWVAILGSVSPLGQ